MAHGMEGRRRSGRKTADPLVDLRTHQTARLQKPARKLKMPAQIVVPVEARSRSRRVHYAKSDHAASIPSVVHDSRLSSLIHSSKRVRRAFDGRRGNSKEASTSSNHQFAVVIDRAGKMR